jgi:ribosomal protein L11 methyltransferase
VGLGRTGRPVEALVVTMSAPAKTWPALDVGFPDSNTRTPDADGFFAAWLDDYSPTAIVDTSNADGLSWRIFFAAAPRRDAAATAISVDWPELRVGAADVPDEQWAERSQASLRAIRVGRLVVAPPWDVEHVDSLDDEWAEGPVDRTGTTLIVIEPSMGFGTGHHESTRLCLRALQRLDLADRRVVDLGTGSGVLAIAAGRLGCASAVALDDDADAVAAARANVERNGLSGLIDVRCEGLGADPALRGDVVLGNLTGGLLRRLAAAVSACVAPGGTLILSGFTADERDLVAQAFAPRRVVDSLVEHGWVALILA